MSVVEGFVESDYPRLLREAADHIEKVGLNQDGNFYQNLDVSGGELDEYDEGVEPADTRPIKERPCCTLGAVKVATGFLPETGEDSWGKYTVAGRISPVSAFLTLDNILTARVQKQFKDSDNPLWGIPPWNDEFATQEQVLTLLRETADELEQEAAGK